MMQYSKGKNEEEVRVEGVQHVECAEKKLHISRIEAADG
jgi:hypothetical protein